MLKSSGPARVRGVSSEGGKEFMVGRICKTGKEFSLVLLISVAGRHVGKRSVPA